MTSPQPPRQRQCGETEEHPEHHDCAGLDGAHVHAGRTGPGYDVDVLRAGLTAVATSALVAGDTATAHMATSILDGRHIEHADPLYIVLPGGVHGARVLNPDVLDGRGIVFVPAGTDPTMLRGGPTMLRGGLFPGDPAGTDLRDQH